MSWFDQINLPSPYMPTARSGGALNTLAPTSPGQPVGRRTDMAWPLLAMAAAGAVRGGLAARGQNRAAENEWQAAEDRRKRENLQFQLYELPQLAQQSRQNVFRNTLGRGMVRNFGADPRTGIVRDPLLAQAVNSRPTFRNETDIMNLNPYAAPIPRPQTGGVLDAFGNVLGGAAEGAATYYSMR